MRNTLTVAILFVCLKTGSGLLIQKPQDSVTVIGQSAYFNCSTSEPSKRIQWYHYDVDEAQREAIYRCDNFTEYWYPCYRNGRYVVERNQVIGAYNLVIPTVVSSDAGRFLCEVDGDEGMANLTVRVESIPTCVASEICEPYIKPYSDAIICFFLIILPTAIIGTVFVLWYLHEYRPKKLKQKGEKMGGSEEEETNLRPIVSSQVNKEEDANDQMANINASSQGYILEETEQLTSTTKIKELEKAVMDLENELKCKVTAYEDQLQMQSDKIEKLQEKNKVSDSEIDQLKARVKDLEQRLYPAGSIDYAEKPTLVHTIIPDVGKQTQKPINGMTILGRELFVLHENNSIFEVYDSDTFQYVRNWVIEGMSDPMDIASCKIANCLYILLRGYNESESQIMKLEPKGQPIVKWSTGGDTGRLSTYESNVIVCLCEKQVINEYSGDGKLIHTVHLSPAVGFNHPWHAIKVTSSHFVVCHGDTKDDLHRVCIVDAQGNIMKELREWESKIKDGTLNVPICLVGDSERSILVADRDNQKIRLLNCFLKIQRNLLKKEKGLDGYPVRICLEESKGRLFVAVNALSKKEWKDGRILIFNIYK